MTCVTGYTGCASSQECCTGGCDIFGPSRMCCIPEGQVCDFSRPTHANHYACCWPLSCDPYKKNTGITVCQESKGRFPDSGQRIQDGEAGDRRGIWNNTIPWYSAENPLWDGSD